MRCTTIMLCARMGGAEMQREREESEAERRREKEKSDRENV